LQINRENHFKCLLLFGTRVKAKVRQTFPLSIFNPMSQGEKFDPEGTYTKKWVPELRNVPPKWIHRPWEASQDILKKAGLFLGGTILFQLLIMKKQEGTLLRLFGKKDRIRALIPRLRTKSRCPYVLNLVSLGSLGSLSFCPFAYFALFCNKTASFGSMYSFIYTHKRIFPLWQSIKY
jgi:hypothetical protein